MPQDRHVRGVLYVDYVRMLRRQVSNWRAQLSPADVALVADRVDVDAWYPMASFERLGLAILEHVVRGEVDSIRLWGRQQVQAILGYLPTLRVDDDPLDAIMRFQNFLSSLFDFQAVALDSVEDGEALVRVDYGMGARAEEAATWQTVGFFEELVTASGGREATGRLRSRAWLPGEPPTVFAVTWTMGAPSPRPFLARPRVLVVDDEPLVARGVTRLLAQVAEVTHALDVPEAIRLLEAREFDSVLADYNLPGRNGLSLLAEVAKRWPRLKRVLHSGAMPAEAAAALRERVAHELIDKPAARDVLVRAVATLPSG
ncbi:MAG: response regulator transcription factor [Myxococcaceae bacterium]|nr:response regulator transcription factor [Myxococcaceae bacterium]